MLTNLFITVLNMSISGALVALLLMGWRILSRRFMPARYIYCLWLVLLFRLAVPFSPKSGLSFMNLIKDSHTYTHGGSYALTMEYLEYSDLQLLLSRGPDEGLQAAAAVWLAVALVLAAAWVVLYLSACLRLRYAVLDSSSIAETTRKDMGIKKSIPVYRSSNLLSPIVIGFFKPKVILPKLRDDPKDMHYAVAHEMVHAVRHDQFIKALFFFAAAVHWFNPLVWLSCYMVNHDIELACDQHVLHVYGEQSKSRYAEVLIGFAERQKTLLSVALSFAKNRVAARIQRVMAYKRPSAAAAFVFAVVTLFIGLSAATNPVFQDKYIYVPDTVYVSLEERREMQRFLAEFTDALASGDSEAVARMSTADPEFFMGAFGAFESAEAELSVKQVFYTSEHSADAHIALESGKLPWQHVPEDLVLRVGHSSLMNGLYADELHPLSRYNAIGSLDSEDEALEIIERLIKYRITNGSNTPENAAAIAAFCMDMAHSRMQEPKELIPREQVESVALEFFLIEDCSNLRATRYYDPASDAYRFDGSIGTYFEYQIIDLQKTETSAVVTVEYYLDPLQTQTESVVKYTLERVEQHEP